jgi:AcrR family transcriptional regulator
MPKVSDAHRQARRREILDAAAACFARQGFHRTSMQDIVRESGISAGLVYRYFASKDEVIAAIVEQWHEHRTRLLTGAAPEGPDAAPEGPDAAGGGHPLPAYLAMLRAIAAPEAADDIRLGVQVWAEALRSPAIGELTRGGVDRFRKLAAGAIRDAEREGGLPAGVEPDALARVLIAIYQGLTLQTAWDGAVDNDAFVRAVAGLVGALTAPAPGHRSGG